MNAYYNANDKTGNNPAEIGQVVEQTDSSPKNGYRTRYSWTFVLRHMQIKSMLRFHLHYKSLDKIINDVNAKFYNGCAEKNTSSVISDNEKSHSLRK